MEKVIPGWTVMIEAAGRRLKAGDVTAVTPTPEEVLLTSDLRAAYKKSCGEIEARMVEAEKTESSD